MSIKRTWFLLGLLLCQGAWAENYPSKPVTLVVPFASNGPMDTLARTLGGAMSKHLKQPIAVENVGGAGGTTGARQVAQAKPDGYTMLMYHVGMATTPALYRSLPFEPLRDFEFVGEVTDVPMTLVARPDFPAKDFKELQAYIKANQGKLRYAHAGPGSASHLCGLLFMAAVETDLQTVAYKGTGPAMDDLLAGKVDLMCDMTTGTTAPIRAGKIKAFGVTTSQRIPSLPDVPTLQENGLKDFHFTVWHALYLPRSTPAPVVGKLVESLQAALQDASVKALCKDLGTDTVPASKATPVYARDHLSAELERWSQVIKRKGEYAD
jgi:tripartite-type tricarboxylate transporter receptor subunit TctC